MPSEELSLVEINVITEVLNYIEGLSVVVFDLDDTLYSEKNTSAADIRRWLR